MPRLKDQAEPACPPVRDGASENHFQQVFEQAVAGLVITDLTGQLRQVNRAFCRITGYTEEELQGKSFADLTFPADVDLSVQAFQRLIAEGEWDHPIEKRYVRKDGTHAWAQISATLVRDDEGRPQGVVSIVDEITHRKFSESAIKNGELTLLGILSAIRESIWMFKNDGTVEMVNPTGLARMGKAFEEVRGKTFYEFLPHDVAEHRMVYFNEVLRSKKAIEFEDHRAGIDFLHNFFPVFDESGEVRSIVSFSRDITDRKRAEDELRYQNNLTRTITDNAGSCLFMMDARGVATYMNPAAERVTGFTLEEIKEKPFHSFVHHHRPDGAAYPSEECPLSVTYTQGKTVHEEEEIFVRKDGSFYPVRYSICPVLVGGKMAGTVLEFRDITAQKKTEEALKVALQRANEANAAKSQFLANVSHEIRTPIGIIMGFSDLLRSAATSSDGERLNYMDIIEKNSKQLLRLVDDILDLSKVEAGKMAIENIDISLSEFLADLHSTKALQAAEKGIEFSVISEGPLPKMVSSDPTRLRQILDNIIGNAIKFTAKGRVELAVCAVDGRLEFVVTDTGIGIAPEQRTRLFQPFEQADPSTTRTYGGTGLGLVLSRRLSRALGGDLVLNWSEPGQGSRFICTIEPRAMGNMNHKPSSSDSATSGQGSLRSQDVAGLQGLKVLLVEDSVDNQVLVASFLKKADAEVTVASDGREGVEKALTCSPEVVLMDIQMPNVDGHEATRILRSSGFLRPIIAVTAHAMREERERCFTSGFTDYLTKPLSRERLIEALARYRSQGQS